MKTMWTYIPEYMRYISAYVQLLYAIYIRPMMKPSGVSEDTKERKVPEQSIFKDPEGRN